MKRLAVVLLASLLAFGWSVPVVAQGEPFECPGAPGPRLVVGMQARVTPGPPNVLRAQPTTSSGQIGGIPGGEVFEVLDGPVCADGYVWWQVDYQGATGWTAEGAPDEYWLEPVVPEVVPITAANAARLRLLVSLTNETVQQVRFSPDSSLLAYSVDQGGVYLWDLGANAMRAAFAGHEFDPVTGMPLLAFSPDGRTLISAGIEGTLRVWDVETGELQALVYGVSEAGAPETEWIILRGDEATNAEDIPAGTIIISPTFSPDGSRLAFTEWTRVNQSAPVVVWRFPELTLEATHEGAQGRLLFAPDGQRIIMTIGPDWDSEVAQVWQPDTGLSTTLSDAGVRSLTLSPDGRTLAVGFPEAVSLYDLDTGREHHTLNASGILVFSPEGTLLSVRSVAWDGALSIFDVATGAQVAEIETNRLVEAFSPDGTLFVMASHDGLLTVYDTATFAVVAEVTTGYGGQIVRLAFSPDGRWIATAGLSTPLQLWGVPRDG